MSEATQRTVVVGIDPGEVTGLAVYDVEMDQLALVTSGGFWAVVSLLHQRFTPASAGGTVLGVVLEDSRGLPIYERNRRGAASRSARDKIARNVGRVDRDIGLWVTWLTESGYRVRLVVPGRRKKWDAERLLRVTGFEGVTNQHGRDAARLVWGVGPGHFAKCHSPSLLDRLNTYKKGRRPEVG